LEFLLFAFYYSAKDSFEFFFGSGMDGRKEGDELIKIERVLEESALELLVCM
jgi:hypothetical protein